MMLEHGSPSSTGGLSTNHIFLRMVGFLFQKIPFRGLIFFTARNAGVAKNDFIVPTTLVVNNLS